MDSPPEQREIKTYYTTVDKVFRGFVSSAALFSLVVLILIAAFLLFRGFEIFADYGLKFITTSKWDIGNPEDPSTAVLGIGAMLVGSVLTAFIAIAVAVPFAIAAALFIEYYAPRFLRTLLTAVLDLVAAIPSVIYGIWGYVVLLPLVEDWSATLYKYLNWFPLFNVQTPIFGRSPLLAGLLLAVMILPIVTSVAREVYGQAPRDLVDASYALGGTKWAGIKTVVLPFGKSGLVGGAMLGLGRAMGETVAVYLTLNLVFKVNFQILASSGGNVASLIANKFGEATAYELKGLMAAGLVLFLVTLLVNFFATVIVNRSRKIV
ncbi:MAG: phosphate ABC transporter permease subunit PstC [Ilumatobacteraceae bacterium]|jgi:phosphate transport system permease protein|nr:phosphate ABC transporter permease subunit PstC [Ilumatobacteraceae bacterium]